MHVFPQVSLVQPRSSSTGHAATMGMRHDVESRKPFIHRIRSVSRPHENSSERASFNVDARTLDGTHKGNCMPRQRGPFQQRTWLSLSSARGGCPLSGCRDGQGFEMTDTLCLQPMIETTTESDSRTDGFHEATLSARQHVSQQPLLSTATVQRVQQAGCATYAKKLTEKRRAYTELSDVCLQTFNTKARNPVPPALSYSSDAVALSLDQEIAGKAGLTVDNCCEYEIGPCLSELRIMKSEGGDENGATGNTGLHNYQRLPAAGAQFRLERTKIEVPGHLVDSSQDLTDRHNISQSGGRDSSSIRLFFTGINFSDPINVTRCNNSSKKRSNTTAQQSQASNDSQLPSFKKQKQKSSVGSHEEAPKVKTDSQHQQTSTNRSEPIFLACPYYKMDPIKHLNCFKRFKLKRVKDVKQYLNRKHAAPENYCPRCWTIFEGRAQWDAHTRSTTCSGSAQRSEQLDVMTPGQQRDVAKRTDSTLTEPDQWFSIWKILFPEKEAPQSPYLGTEMQEIIWTVQHCWTANSHQIVKDLVAARRRVPTSGEFSVAVSGNEVIGDGGIHQYTKEVLTDAMNMLLRQVEGKMDGMDQLQSPWLPAQEPSEAVTNFDVGSEVSRDDESSSLAVPGLFTSQTRGTDGAGEYLFPSDTHSDYLLSADTYSLEPFPAFPDDISQTPRALTSLESFPMDPAEFEQLPNLFDEPFFNQETYSVDNEHEDW